jgi:sugar O-acyltransferase (sialic acid O-acetyltransferase NeuD family)
MKKVIVFGDNIYAKMLYADAQKRNEFLIEAFCVDKLYLKGNVFCNKPLMDFNEAIVNYPPDKYDMISTVQAPSRMRNILLVFNRLKEAGYTLRNYISPLADVGTDILMGENNLIFPFAHIGCNTKIGNANIFNQNIYLAHDANVGNGNFFAGACTFAGYCHIGNSCFLGINSSIIEHVHIADETLIGAGSVVLKDTNPHTLYVGNPAKPISTHEEDGITMKVWIE